MKTPRWLICYFIILLSCTSSTASAHYKIIYETTPLYWEKEWFHFGDNNLDGETFFIDDEISFAATLIVPEFAWDAGGPPTLRYENPVVDVKASEYFGSVDITSSFFELEISEWEGEIFGSWVMGFDILDTNTSSSLNGGTSRGSFLASGWLIPDTGGYGGATFTYYLDNWTYRRQQMEWQLYSIVDFLSYDSGKITLETITVPEPKGLLLLLTGFILIFALNARRKLNL